ncbi:MAG: hypothetical protein II719_00975 [Clostridia bacterium]|nr:hypothetical protein [Clostridia bacterium]
MPYRSASARMLGSSDRLSLINRNNLDSKQYLRSLIAESLRVGLLTIETVDDIQMQIRGCLETLIRERSRSSDVPLGEEGAKEMLDSVFFTIGIHLLSFHDPMYAITALQSTSMEELFAAGRQRIRELFCDSVSLYVRCRHNPSAPHTQLYRKALTEDLRTFLDRYDPVYFAQKSVCRISYTLAVSFGDKTGILYLHDYLLRLFAENSLLSKFDPEEISLLMKSCAKHYHTAPDELTVNCFSVVMHHAIGAALLGKYTGILTLTEEEVGNLYKGLYRKTSRELKSMTYQAVVGLVSDLCPNDLVLSGYISAFSRSFSEKLLEARSKGERSGLFLVSNPQELFRH